MAVMTFLRFGYFLALSLECIVCSGDAASGPATRDGQCYGNPGNKTFITKCADDADVCVKYYTANSNNATFNTVSR